METENIYEKIREILGKTPGNFNILEERIDIDLQVEYFEVSREVKLHLDAEKIVHNKEDIFNLEIPENIRKIRFAELASMENVEAYRLLEKYIKSQFVELRSWAVLALQESRMLLESKLLDEKQVFISTGLGGKGTKLRYFVVLILKKDMIFSDLNQKVIRNEFGIIMKNNNADIEQLDFYSRYATLTVIIPLNISIKKLFHDCIRECNLYGDFLSKDYIITNVKELSGEEIESFLNSKQI